DYHDRNPNQPGPYVTFHNYDDDRELAVALLCLPDSVCSERTGQLFAESLGRDALAARQVDHDARLRPTLTSEGLFLRA
ncbi:hypothetical protein BDW02DRAFT_512483, partial [Decorospora gaudefroyi]